MKQLKWIDCGLSVLFCAALWYGLTGGALVQGREVAIYWSAHLFQYEMLRVAILLLAAACAFWRYRVSPATFTRVEPFGFLQTLTRLPAWVPLLLLCGFYFATQFLTLTAMHAGLRTAMWDLGFYEQILWNTAHGRVLIVAVRGGMHLLGHHFEPILILMAPLYWIWANTHMLFIFMAVMGALNLVLVYGIAKDVTGSHKAGLLFAVVAFFYQPLRNGYIFPLQTQVFADPFLLLGFWLFLRHRYAFSIFAFALALMCKESIVVDMTGLAIFMGLKRYRFGWAVIGLAALSTVAILLIEPIFFWKQDTWDKWNYFKHLLTLNPAVWKTLLAPNPLLFLILVFAPVLGLPLATRAGWGLLLPSLAFRLLSAYGGFRLITAHYTAGMNALILTGAIYGYQKITRGWQSQGRKGNPWPVALGFAAFLFAGVPQLYTLENYLYEATNGPNQRIVKILESVPEEYATMSTEVLLAHLTHRPHVFSMTSVFSDSPLHAVSQNVDFIFIDEKRIQEDERAVLQQFIERGYHPVFQHEFMTVYSKPAGRDLTGMVAGWQAATAEPERAYRKQVRYGYKRVLIGAAVLLLGLLFLRTFRQKGTGIVESSYSKR